MIQTEKIKQWIQVYGLKNVILRGIYSRLPVIPVSDNELIRRMNWQLRTKKRLQKYLIVVDKPVTKENPYPKTIWWLWFQGSESAPLIVKKCLEVARQYADEMQYNLMELNKNNLFNYVDLPAQIVDKWKKGIIGNANFSDLCRVALLADYGGIWMDSTVFMSGPLDKEIRDAELFFFKASFLDMTITKISNWFMSANSAGNLFLYSVRESMIRYWMQNNYVADYFIFHIVVAALSERKEFKEMFDAIPYFTNTYPQLLGMELNKSYDEGKFRHIIKCSNIHKLTYKNLENSLQDSVYQHLLAWGLEREK